MPAGNKRPVHFECCSSILWVKNLMEPTYYPWA